MKVKAPFVVESVEPGGGIAFWNLHSYRLLHNWYKLEWDYWYECALTTVYPKRKIVPHSGKAGERR